MKQNIEQVKNERDIWRNNYGKAQQEIAEMEEMFEKQDKLISHYKERAGRAETLIENIMHGDLGIDREKLMQWIEDKKYVYSAPELDDTDEEKAVWKGCMRILNGLSGFIDTGYFDTEADSLQQITKTPDVSSEV